MTREDFALLKIIHTADIHLDKPFHMEDKQKEEARKNELRAAFSSLMLWAKTQEADIMLIAGDLFDSPHPTAEAVDFVFHQFASNPRCRFVIAPGEHDFSSSDSVWMKAEFPENVSVFRASQLTCLHFDNIAGYEVNIYGYAFTAPILNKNPIKGFHAEASDAINLFCAHASVGEGNGKISPVSPKELGESGLDYIALGHIHNTAGIKKMENVFFGYPGSLEPHGFNECGEHGAFLIEADKRSTVFSCRPAFCRLAKRVYAVETLDLTALSSENAILDKVNALFKQKGYGQNTLLRLTFEGRLSAEVDLPLEGLKALTSHLYYCEITDRTVPEYDLEALLKDPTVKGELARALSAMLSSEKEEEQRIAARALKYGLSALSGKNVSTLL